MNYLYEPSILKLIIDNKINEYNNYLKIMDDLLYKINNYKFITKKYKHNPFAFNENDMNVEIKNGKMIIQYKDQVNNQTILFNTNEKYRSFSFEPAVNRHIEQIKTQLNCEINIININIDYMKNIKIKLNNNTHINNFDIDNIYNVNYDLNEVLYKYNNIDRYILSICPIYSFVLNKQKIYIANQYVLNFENNKFHLFYDYKHNFKRLLGRPNLHNKILDFNKNKNKTISIKNVFKVIENMKNIFTDYTITNEFTNESINFKLKNIDEIIN